MKDFSKMKNTINNVENVFGTQSFTRKEYEKMALETPNVYSASTFLYDFLNSGVSVQRIEKFVATDDWGRDYIAYRYHYVFDGERAREEYKREIARTRDLATRRYLNCEKQIRELNERKEVYKALMNMEF